PGLTGDGWSRSAHSFYDLEGSARLAAALASFEGGRLVVATMDMPIACPVAPLEFSFLADWHLRTRGVRAKVELVYLTPLDGAFTKATCNRELEGLLADKGVEVVTDFTTAEVDRHRRRIVAYDGREVAYDLAVVVPLHEGAAYVSASDGLGDALGFVPADPATLQSRARPNVFVIGDAADLPAPKAASVAHFEGAVLEANIVAFLEERPPPARFDGHASCFIESGFHKALLIDYNYDLEPVPGHFPARVGLPLLRQSHLNHLGKRAFEQLYWHVLLPGRELPGVRSDMPESGKRRDLIAA
ncbi:MAG TPA: FAD/NAD(P)-binding oxidoreductase, partial [Acidimicrobiales bacterium]|nr:FAD/NAD(P)-binding oxidoreductase [Acidimicrobiales bacterium]